MTTNELNDTLCESWVANGVVISAIALPPESYDALMNDLALDDPPSDACVLHLECGTVTVRKMKTHATPA